MTECVIRLWSSRACERGTRGCVMIHTGPKAGTIYGGFLDETDEEGPRGPADQNEGHPDEWPTS
jgi:hypothetical protein